MESTKRKNIPGLLLLIDFEKAFDSISHSYIQKCLKYWGFKSSLRQWVNLFYTNITSSILYNGHCSDSFQIGRGVRQGDPLSPYLFILVAECLGAAIKKDEKVKGLVIFGTEYLISQYADDTTLFLDGSEESLLRVLKILEEFGNCSGLKINTSKTEAIWI